MSSAAQPDPSAPTDDGLSRRGFLSRAAAVSAGASAGLVAGAAAPVGAERAAARPADLDPDSDLDPNDNPAGSVAEVVLLVNGRRERLLIDPRTTLLDALRDRLGLTGTKKGCDRGQCGSCTVHVDGRPALSCLILAVSLTASTPVTTIEGLADGDRLHPMQQAFEDCDAFQCGFCTPGMIMSAVALAGEQRDLSYDEIREHMSGNLCRCGAYPAIVEAVRTTRERTTQGRTAQGQTAHGWTR